MIAREGAAVGVNICVTVTVGVIDSVGVEVDITCRLSIGLTVNEIRFKLEEGVAIFEITFGVDILVAAPCTFGW